MIGLIQRVTHAAVAIEGVTVAEIGRGLLVLIGVQRGDEHAQAARLAERLVGYRVFADAAGRMNLSVREIGGALLLVPQFTLAADTSSGLRPSFSRAAAAEQGVARFGELVEEVALRGIPYGCGRFGAAMQVTLTNDGPVTFWLEVPPTA